MNLKNRIPLLALLCIGLFASNQARAFYNPQTGRWLNRDPLNEPGFLVLSQQPSPPWLNNRILNRNPATASCPFCRNGQGRSSPVPRQATSQAHFKYQNNLYDFVGNDPTDGYDINGLLNSGTCTVAAESAVTVAAGIAALPAEAIILGTVIAAEGVVITYELCPKIRICSPGRYTFCWKTEDWFETNPNSPWEGERLCKYKCNDGQVHLGVGTECDNDPIYIPSPF